MTAFTLVSDPGSTLVADESGSLCGNTRLSPTG